MGFGVRLQRTLANLKRGYEKESETELSDSSWYERFTPELTEFFKKSVSHAIVQLANEQPEDIAKLYGARWDIELVFKELKSRYTMDVINTKNTYII